MPAKINEVRERYFSEFFSFDCKQGQRHVKALVVGDFSISYRQYGSHTFISF